MAGFSYSVRLFNQSHINDSSRANFFGKVKVVLRVILLVVLKFCTTSHRFTPSPTWMAKSNNATAASRV